MRKLIYTCITGEYDDLKEPQYVTEGWEYSCSTDRSDLKSDVWDVGLMSTMPYGNENLSDVKKARCLKINPPQDYDVTIWIDASFTIVGDLDKFVLKYLKTDWAMLQHPTRDCIYDEYYGCLYHNRGNQKQMLEQLNGYAEEGMPKNYGMGQTGVLVRRNTKAVHALCHEWWNQVRDKSERDQLSFPYAHWKRPLPYTTINYIECIANYFVLARHNNGMI